MSKIELFGVLLPELETQVVEWGYKKFFARTILEWIYQKGVYDFARMSSLPETLRQVLRENCRIALPDRVKVSRSQDGTAKMLFALEDGQAIEAVSIPAKGRHTGCISSQVGCKFGCSFCASGISGFVRNLSAGEIVAEVMGLQRQAGERLTHLVFMGTGEPLDNYAQVLKAIRILNAPYGAGIGARRITISTCGVVPGILALAKEGLQVELSVSLHASDDETRSRLLPVNRKYPLTHLLDACAYYSEATNRQVTFEYILIQGVNADLRSAKNLSILLKKLRLPKVNLIPANPVPQLHIHPPSAKEVRGFIGELEAARIPVTVRRSRGADIDAACGQLRLSYEKKERSA
jgi:23S rRNA (adenine2503-C2)-methyltransferase